MKYRYIISSALLALVVFTLSAMAWFKPADEYSESERRPFDQFPELTLDTILKGEFTADFEGYVTDQFPFRDDFRTLKAIAKFYIFNQKDNNDIYIHDSHASKLDTELSEKDIAYALEKMNQLYETYVKGKTDNVYFSVIPDKSYTLAPAGGYPSVDYEEIAKRFENELNWAKFIDIYPYLEYNDYYTTDTHWSQDKIVDVARTIADAMGATVEKEYEKITLDNDFYGVYYGQSSLPLPPDKITYLTSDVIEGCNVHNYETGKDGSVYNMDKLNSKDPYEMFLSGACALMRIDNPSNPDGKTLIMFRDSYTSSIAPLLLESYSKVFLIDTRYIVPSFVGEFVTEADFANADVLFMYSAMILNSSASLK